jgi:hypothetical protein
VDQSNEGSGLEDYFVFFKHEDEGTGPRLASQFIDLNQVIRSGLEIAAARVVTAVTIKLDRIARPFA